MELFQFGKGTPSEAHKRACVPSAIAGFPSLVGSAVLDEDMLLLAFNTSMQYMEVTISMPTNMVHFAHALGFQRHFTMSMAASQSTFWTWLMIKFNVMFG